MIVNYRPTGLTGFDPDEFPEAHDLTVELTAWEEGQLNLTYVVSSPPIVINWGWWSEPVAKIRAWTLADVPWGTIEEPYYDSDQGWNIMLWQIDDHIFVAEGDGARDE